MNQTFLMPDFEARIRVTRTQDGENTRMIDCMRETVAQQEFDKLTAKGNEHEGYLQWDLEVKHPEIGMDCQKNHVY